MYPLSVPWNVLHSSMCVQRISLIARYLRPVMWWTKHIIFRKNKNKKNKEKQDWILQAKQDISTDIWIWPSRVIRGQKYFHYFGSPYMPSYLTSIGTFSLSRTVFEIFDFKVFRVWPWPLTFRGHLKSKIFLPFESPYMPSILLLWHFLSISYRFRDIRLQSF